MVELGEIVRRESVRYLQTRFVSIDERKAMRDIALCRTEAMGLISATCERCGTEYRLFRSCRNRSCPLCQNEARSKWLEAREQEILPIPYLHVVFTAPAELNEVALSCPEEFYDVLVRAAGQAVIEVGRSELHAQLGCLAQLHTWGQSMALHLHVHCMVPCGGFSDDGSRWISFEANDLSGKALSRRFRVLMCKGLQTAAREGKLERLDGAMPLEQLLSTLLSREWSVYAKPPFGGPHKLLEYLSRYTYRVAITNDRIESYNDQQVTFRWRDYRHRNEEKLCTLEAQEFLRRFLMHVPPSGFVRVRSYGYLGNRNRKKNIERARELIGTAEAPRLRQPFQPLRLCPACCRRDARKSHFAPRPAGPQLDLQLRPPPRPVAS